MGSLGANLGSVVEGEERGAVLLPCGFLGDYGDPGITGAVGGVTLFLEYAEEVVAFKFPSAVHVYGILGWWAKCCRCPNAIRGSSRRPANASLCR